jgi:hypothetical protein
VATALEKVLGDCSLVVIAAAVTVGTVVADDEHVPVLRQAVHEGLELLPGEGLRRRGRAAGLAGLEVAAELVPAAIDDEQDRRPVDRLPVLWSKQPVRVPQQAVLEVVRRDEHRLGHVEVGELEDVRGLRRAVRQPIEPLA